MERLSRRYKGEDSAVAHSNWARTSGVVEGVTQHSVNMSLLSQRYKTGGVGQVEVKHHTINMALLLHRYGLAVSSTTALNALQNNNYYYDVVSRGNVIGGY
jgi:ribosomal protein L24